MTHFVLTRKGFDELVAGLGQPPSPLWVNAGVLSDCELVDLRSRGVSVTNFTTFVDAAVPTQIDQALETIQEHHPGRTVWVEHGHGL